MSPSPDGVTTAVKGALAAMDVAGPMPLIPLAAATAAASGVVVTEPVVRDIVATSDTTDVLPHALHLALAKWDSDETGAWSGDTSIRTTERRCRVYDLLQLDEATRDLLTTRFPVRTDGTIVISEHWEQWYTRERRSEHSFYWDAYSRYLSEVRHWSPDAISSLHTATTKVVERLSDPQRAEAYQSKGLVVGYVQSGKTANFTGVVAKAIDAGYRLIIVMTGTVDILRAQTQRRLDMELVGRENILRGVDPTDTALMADLDYQQDEAWEQDKFIRHGFLPSDHNYPDIIRLTGHKFDYKRLRNAINALEFERLDRSLPLHHPTNLYRSNARLMIVKKNKSVLEKLVKDLKSIKPRLAELPALLIDDESDQASINTTDPKKAQAAIDAGRPYRTAINGLISELLTLLKRGQYVGYTATPFANVFIDPGDAEDIFPKDFLISLERPPGYMGVADFHDVDSPVDPEDRTKANSNEKAYVRNLRADTDQKRQAELLTAMDSFVLAGAVKLFREEHGADPFRHHTMLVHESVKQADHLSLAQTIRAIWNTAGYSLPEGMARLRALWDDDFSLVSAARASGEPIPTSFTELRHLVPVVVSRVTAHENPVLIINGDKDIEQPELDFDRGSVWRILVGGTKLSRGFTVEGLTTSYYRRKTKQADTLMQMGRWFGFRNGYRDLVRLFIGRAEPDGARRIDLYTAFEAVVRDEEAFRAELRRYAVEVDGQPQVTPAQIPPLVSQHLPWLKPAGRNKMFNARLVVRRWAGEFLEPTGYPEDEASKAHNYEVARPLLLATGRDQVPLMIPAGHGGPGRFPARVGTISAAALLNVLERLRWYNDEYFAADLAFYREITDAKRVEDWVVVAPQPKNAAELTIPDVGPWRVVNRERREGRGGLFGAISDPKHRPAVEVVAGAFRAYGDPHVDPLAQKARGGVLVYVIADKENGTKAFSEANPTAGDLVVSVSLVAPAASAGVASRVVQFVARNSALPNQPIVPAP